MPRSSLPGASSLLENNGTGPGWGALIDGHLIPVNPRTAGVRVPSIFGSTTQEGSLSLLSEYGMSIIKLNQSTYSDFLEFNFGPLASVVNQTYSLAKFARTGLPVYTAMMSILTTYSYRCSAYRGLKGAAKNGVPAWTYSFGHTPSCSWHQEFPESPSILKLLGPTHSSEVPFVFNQTTHLPPPDGICHFSESEKDLADTMSTVWKNMAATGTPGDDSLWPEWSIDSSSGVNINEALDVGTVDYSMCSGFWDHIMDGVAHIAEPTAAPGKPSDKVIEPWIPETLSQLAMGDMTGSRTKVIPPNTGSSGSSM